MDLREVTEFIKDTLWYVVAIIILILIFNFVVALQPVAGNSMAPTLQDGQITLVSRFSYYFQVPRRNEIVIIKKNSKSYVKRVVGLPGEKVEYLNGILFVNGEGFKESFLDEKVVTSNFLFEDICSKKDCPNGVIPENKFLVLGDNRSESEDSRSSTFGLVDRKEIKGKVIFKVIPFGKL